MADPQAVLRERVSGALAAIGVPGADPVVRPSPRADFQVNAAMALGKELGRSPRAVAQDIVAAALLADVCETVEVAGAGFINLTLRDDFLVACLADVTAPRWGVELAAEPERVVIDFSAPNVAKEMHVGHLRSTVIGDSLARTLTFLGHDVIRQNHLGDWGTPFGMLIEHLVDMGEDAAAHELSVGDLNGFYREARDAFDADLAFAGRARQRVVDLQSGDPETLRLWRILVDQSETYFAKIYAQLKVTLTADDYRGESTYNDQLAAVVHELDHKDLLVEDDGAQCVFPPGFVGRDGDPLPLIVRKRDGGYGYDATDLAAIRYRAGTLHSTRLIYVVGAPQADHLAMVFAVAAQAGWLTPAVRAEHVAFGSVLGEDGRMFRTRGGDTVKLTDLLDEAVRRAAVVVQAKDPNLTTIERDRVARAVGIGAVKYADLSNDRINDCVFDWDRMLALQGNTAPYLQYAHARVQAIFRKIDQPLPRSVDCAAVRLTEPTERQLVMNLLGFDGAVRSVAETLRPHRLCTYLLELAQTFATFYERCPVLLAEAEIRASRLALCAMTAGVLATGLDLLGIEAPTQI